MDQDSPPEAPGPLMPATWMVVALLATVASVVGVGAMGYSSESAGMTASTFASFPLGFACSGAATALVVHLLVKRGVARIVAPLGCGCLGGVGLFVGLGVFYAVIWPSL